MSRISQLVKWQNQDSNLDFLLAKRPSVLSLNRCDFRCEDSKQLLEDLWQRLGKQTNNWERLIARGVRSKSKSLESALPGQSYSALSSWRASGTPLFPLEENRDASLEAPGHVALGPSSGATLTCSQLGLPRCQMPHSGILFKCHLFLALPSIDPFKIDTFREGN